MTPPAVPIPPGLTRRYSTHAEGRAWLGSLPRLIERCLEQWELVPDLAPGTLPWSGHGAVVVPVRERDSSGSTPGPAHEAGTAVLKVAYPHGEALPERHALALWAGRGAVLLKHVDLRVAVRIGKLGQASRPVLQRHVAKRNTVDGHAG